MDIARTQAWKDGCLSLVKHARHYALIRTGGNSIVGGLYQTPIAA
jgi:hypothetical protein